MFGVNDTVFKCALKWKNRIGMASKQRYADKIDQNIDARWKTVVHSRISSHVKLYTSFLCYSTYFLVAHRNMVSVYDLRKNTWGINFEYDDIVRCLSLNNPTPIKAQKLDGDADTSAMAD